MFKNLKNNLNKFIHLNLLRRKYYKKGQCLGCGSCCKKIYVKTSKHVITDEKEFEKLRLLHPFYSYLTVIDKDETGLVFACSKLDEKTNLCTIHKNRPGICKRYPQEGLFQMGGQLSEGCGYKMIPIESFEEVLKKQLKKK